jgi:CPA2 family monovalent cation:H+ antiporter-2
MAYWDYVQQLVLLLGTAMLLGALFERLRQSAILGYILAGCLLGPGALNLISGESALHVVAEVGVALLLFTVGLEFSLKRLLAMGMTAIGGGMLQIAVTTVVFAVIGLLAGPSAREALALGLIVAPSSTACVMRLLRDRAETDSVHGRHAMGILLLQDLALVPMVVLMTAMGREKPLSGMAADIAIAVGFFILLAALFYLTSVYIVPRAMSAAALLRNREILILLATVMALGAMWAAHLLSVSPALGAFIAGMLLAESPFAAQIRSDIGTLRVLLVTLFFASVGMAADLPWIARHWVEVALATFMVISLKAAIVWAILRAFRKPAAQSVATGICLAQIGEFSFVLAAIGHAEGAVSAQLRQLMVSASVGTLLLTPVLVAAAPRVGRRMAELAARMRRSAAAPTELAGSDDPIEVLRDHVVIVGFGPAGRSVAGALGDAGVPFVIVELNPDTVAEARREGMRAELGDFTQEDVLEHVHATRARAVVVTIPDHAAALHAVAVAHAVAPEVPLIVRSRYHRYVRDFTDAGATFVIDEETQVGSFLGKSLVLGLSRQTR